MVREQATWRKDLAPDEEALKRLGLEIAGLYGSMMEGMLN